jgi:hypothetical protein
MQTTFVIAYHVAEPRLPGLSFMKAQPYSIIWSTGIGGLPKVILRRAIVRIYLHHNRFIDIRAIDIGAGCGGAMGISYIFLEDQP